jgi:hypothetical protein
MYVTLAPHVVSVYSSKDFQVYCQKVKKSNETFEKIKEFVLMPGFPAVGSLTRGGGLSPLMIGSKEPLPSLQINLVKGTVSDFLN